MLTRRDLLRGAAAGVVLAPLGACKKSSDLTVGAKDFQEQWILSHLLAQILADATDLSTSTKQLAGSLAHEALKSGDLDTYVEYTGTAYIEILEEPPSTDPQHVYDTVVAAYAERWNLLWLPPLGFVNTFAIAVRPEDANKHGLATISDLRKVQDQLRPGFGFQFYERADGYRALTRAYDLDFAAKPKQMKLSLLYTALEAGEVDVIAGNSTDGLIDHLGLVVLEDDQSFFPPYQACPVLRKQTADEHPKVLDTLRSLEGAITAEAMRAANYQVDHDQLHPKVAAQNLRKAIDR